MFSLREAFSCPTGSELFLLLSLRDGFCFAKRVRGRLFFHCVAGFSLPRGLGGGYLFVTA
jgi:hypothetical protein